MTLQFLLFFVTQKAVNYVFCIFIFNLFDYAFYKLTWQGLKTLWFFNLVSNKYYFILRILCIFHKVHHAQFLNKLRILLSIKISLDDFQSEPYIKINIKNI